MDSKLGLGVLTIWVGTLLPPLKQLFGTIYFLLLSPRWLGLRNDFCRLNLNTHMKLERAFLLSLPEASGLSYRLSSRLLCLGLLSPKP